MDLIYMSNGVEWRKESLLGGGIKAYEANECCNEGIGEYKLQERARRFLSESDYLFTLFSSECILRMTMS